MADEQEQTEPRCYGHAFDPAHRRGVHDFGDDGWPAHTWEAGPERGACLFDGAWMQNGDRYVCINGGVIHVACVTRLDAEVLAGAGQ